MRLSLMVAGVVRKNNRVCQVSNSRITPDEFKFYFDCAGIDDWWMCSYFLSLFLFRFYSKIVMI